jgi:hypothetical protein
MRGPIRTYFSLNKRFTKSRFAFDTSPSLRRLRLRLVDFLVRICRLYDFWWVIFPVPVILKRFLALELVFTLGITENLSITLEASLHRQGIWRASSGKIFQKSFIYRSQTHLKWPAKIHMITAPNKKNGSIICFRLNS